ncbi:MAG: hypothetical protein KatS3mg053_2270 [Candidatus Roseilinea sp.]|nr:MAG: hypothetical protein KatS3mg053_2270 [Candidatus Roseilinea sp.]
MDFVTVSVAALWIIVALTLMLLFALARQIGVLHERMGYSGARIMNAGPAIGNRVPSVGMLDDVRGNSVSLGGKRGKSTLMLFISMGCANCAALIPSIKKLAKSDADKLEILLVTFGTDLESSQKYIRDHDLDTSISYVLSDELAMKFQVSIAPYGLVIDSDEVLRSKGVVNSFSDIESLLNAAELKLRSIQEYFEVEQQKVPQVT